MNKTLPEASFMNKVKQELTFCAEKRIARERIDGEEAEDTRKVLWILFDTVESLSKHRMAGPLPAIIYLIAALFVVSPVRLPSLASGLAATLKGIFSTAQIETVHQE